MIKGKRRRISILLSTIFLLNSIMIIQYGYCIGYDILWNFKAGDRVMDVAISDDGSTIAIVGYDRNLHLLCSRNNTPIWSHNTSDSLFSTTISSNGNYIATGSSGGYVRFYEKGNLEPLWVYHTGASVRSLAIHPDGSLLVAGSNDNRLYLFNKISSTPLWIYHAPYSIKSIAISSDGNYIAAASCTYDRGILYLFSKSSNTPLWSISSSYIWSVDMSSDGDYVVSGCGLSYIAQEGNITLFHRSSNDPLWYYDSTPYLVYRVAISTNGHYIAATTASEDDNKLYFFERSTPNPIWTPTLPGSTSEMKMADDGRYLVVGLGSLVHYYDTSAKQLKWRYNARNIVESVDISSDGTLIVGADESGNVWLMKNGKTIISYLIVIIPTVAVATVLISIIIYYVHKKSSSHKA